VMADSRFRAPAPPGPHCPVCRSARIRCDSVNDGTLLHIAECPHCEHRWTWRGIAIALGRPSGQSRPMRALKVTKADVGGVGRVAGRELTSAA